MDSACDDAYRRCSRMEKQGRRHRRMCDRKKRNESWQSGSGVGDVEDWYSPMTGGRCTKKCTGIVCVSLRAASDNGIGGGDSRENAEARSQKHPMGRQRLAIAMGLGCKSGGITAAGWNDLQSTPRTPALALSGWVHWTQASRQMGRSSRVAY